MSTRNAYLEQLSRAVKASNEPDFSAGASGYFSSPSQSLDPRLFDDGTDVMRDDIRSWIQHTFHRFMESSGFRNSPQWTNLWVAGSAITYQWNASRGGLGDLDVLIGVDFPAFRRHNPAWRLADEAIADALNSKMKAELWPKTANVLGGFEATFYVNVGGTDIRNLNPYAAYNVGTDEWTVRPPALHQGDQHDRHSKAHWEAFNREHRIVKDLVTEYRHPAEGLSIATPGSPAWTNAAARTREIAARARALFDDIHLGRRRAFAPSGQGYNDFYNFRWQAHKEAGSVGVLRDIGALDREAEKAVIGDVPDTSRLIARAALWNTAQRGAL